MTDFHSYIPSYDLPSPPVPEVPSEFIRLAESLPRGTDRKLGYIRDARFVMFYYEPLGDEVIWDDGRTYGFGMGGWCAFADAIAPLAVIYQVTLGSSNASGSHVLLLDRMKQEAFFAERAPAKRFLAGRRELLDDV